MEIKIIDLDRRLEQVFGVFDRLTIRSRPERNHLRRRRGGWGGLSLCLRHERSGGVLLEGHRLLLLVRLHVFRARRDRGSLQKFLDFAHLLLSGLRFHELKLFETENLANNLPVIHVAQQLSGNLRILERNLQKLLQEHPFRRCGLRETRIFVWKCPKLAFCEPFELQNLCLTLHGHQNLFRVIGILAGLERGKVVHLRHDRFNACPGDSLHAHRLILGLSVPGSRFLVFHAGSEQRRRRSQHELQERAS